MSVFYLLINYNPVDYNIWDIMEEHVYKRRLNNVDELKWRLIDVWHGLQQTVINSAVMAVSE